MKTCRGVFHVLLCGRQITVVATVKPSIESLPINVTGSAVRESSKRSLRGVGDRFSAIGCLNVSQFQRISGVRAVEGDEKKKKKNYPTCRKCRVESDANIVVNYRVKQTATNGLSRLRRGESMHVF